MKQSRFCEFFQAKAITHVDHQGAAIPFCRGSATSCGGLLSLKRGGTIVLHDPNARLLSGWCLIAFAHHEIAKYFQLTSFHPDKTAQPLTRYRLPKRLDIAFHQRWSANQDTAAVFLVWPNKVITRFMLLLPHFSDIKNPRCFTRGFLEVV